MVVTKHHLEKLVNGKKDESITTLSSSSLDYAGVISNIIFISKRFICLLLSSLD